METHSYFLSFSQEIPPEIAPHIIGWARVPPAKAYKYPGAPAYWCAMLALDPSQPDRKPVKGYFWLFHPGRVREVYAAPFEIVKGTERPPD